MGSEKRVQGWLVVPEFQTSPGPLTYHGLHGRFPAGLFPIRVICVIRGQSFFLFHQRDDFPEVVHHGFEFGDGFGGEVLRSSCLLLVSMVKSSRSGW